MVTVAKGLDLLFACSGKCSICLEEKHVFRCNNYATCEVATCLTCFSEAMAAHTIGDPLSKDRNDFLKFKCFGAHCAGTFGDDLRSAVSGTPAQQLMCRFKIERERASDMREEALAVVKRSDRMVEEVLASKDAAIELAAKYHERLLEHMCCKRCPGCSQMFAGFDGCAEITC